MHHLCITRTAQPTEQRSPWEDIAFVHTVDSDELADVLKVAYPGYRTLRERKHAAIIEFFQYELERMRPSDNTPVSTKTPPISSLHGMSPLAPETQIEICSGVHPRDLKAPPLSPASSNNSVAYRETTKRYPVTQTTSSQSLPANPKLATTTTQLVFNAFDGRPMQQKTKRKMTSEERREYKETRRRGACAKCKRQKGKCTHLDDADGAVDNADTVVEGFKRRISIGPATTDPKPNEALKLETTTPTYDLDPDASQQHGTFSRQQQLLHPSRRSSSASDHPSAAVDELQQPAETGHQLDTSGYVSQSSSFEQTQSSFTNTHTTSFWSSFDTFNMDPEDCMDSFQMGHCFDANQDRTAFPPSPSIHVQGPDQDSYYAPQLPVGTSWTYGQSPRPDNTGYT